MNFELTLRSNGSLQHVKQQVMEELTSLRLVELLNCSHAYGVHNFNMQFATLQLINQICDETPKHYKLICLSGILAHLKEFAKDASTFEPSDLSLSKSSS